MNITNKTLFAVIGILSLSALADESKKYDPFGAEWQKQWTPEFEREIDERIDRCRKADALVEGIPAGVEVSIDQEASDFQFGANIFNFGQLGSAEMNEKYRAVFTNLLNGATVPFYWHKLEPEQGKPRYEPRMPEDSEEFWNNFDFSNDAQNSYLQWRVPCPDPILDFCDQYGVSVHGHAMIYHHCQPEWVWAMSNDVEQVRETYKSHVRELARRYGGRIPQWDVVNESLNRNSTRENTDDCGCWYDPKRKVTLPPGYTLDAFKEAEAGFPREVKLAINDAWGTNDAYDFFIANLIDKGAKIDVIGMQMHIFRNWELLEIASGRPCLANKRSWNVNDVVKHLKRLSRLGRQIHLSEITIPSPRGEAGLTDAEADEIQAKFTRAFYRLWFSWPEIYRITYWDLVDYCGFGNERLSSGWFNRDMTPKAVYRTMEDLILREWRTHLRVKADAEGKVRFRGFKGKYRISWKDSSGKIVEKRIHLASSTHEVKLDKLVGKLRPELHSSGFVPHVADYSPQEMADIKSMGFRMSRTHDWAIVDYGERVCDYFHIFPLMHLDAKDPKNYHFAPTDYMLGLARNELGSDIFFRLGTSIEHSGPKVHFNALIPEDFDKVAETFAGTVRHYNRGWANGFDWGIKYWEIWNEPDGQNTMWCLPDGDRLDGDVYSEEKTTLRREKFVKFFVTCLKRLKSEFSDIKVGGPALCNMNKPYFVALLDACKEAGIAPDFISWHNYSCDPEKFIRSINEARKLCDDYGFNDCELIVNEWHYFNTEWWMLNSRYPSITKMPWMGVTGHNNINSACYTLTMLARFQASKLDQAYYYGCRHDGAWGYRNSIHEKYKTYYALKLFGDIIRDFPALVEVKNRDSVSMLVSKSEDGKRISVLVADYCSYASEIVLDFGLMPLPKPRVTILDAARNFESIDPKIEGSRLILPKRDRNSAAFQVVFELK